MKNNGEQAGIITQEITLKILTPTYIGGSVEDNLNKNQYIFNAKAKQVIVIDEKKLANFLRKRNLTQSYINFINQNSKKSEPDHFNVWFKQENLTSEDLKKFIKHILSSENVDTQKINDIHSFIKNIYGEPYLPGSSLKGAIRTAIACHTILNKPKSFKDDRVRLRTLCGQDRVDLRAIKRLAGDMEKRIFSFSPGEKVLIKSTAGLSVGDSNPLKVNDLCLVKKEDISYGSEESHTISVFRECLKPKSKTQFKLTLDLRKTDPEFGFNETLDVFEALETMKELLIGESGVYQVFENLDDYIPSYDETARLLFLGGGAGFYSKTILSALFTDPQERLEVVRNMMDVKFKNKKHSQDDPISPRTLKLATFEQKPYLMGMCEITKTEVADAQ